MISVLPSPTGLRPAASPSLYPADSLRLQDTILAPATPSGPGARAILRLSGPEAWRLLHPLLQETSRWPVQLQPGRCDARLRLPDFFSPLPVALQLWAAPRSYTGQDLVEIHLISSPPLVQALLDLLIEHGARLARPGEFTLRAFLAGKLDLTGAEAVLTLTTSSDPDELRQALTRLAGGVSRPLDRLREELLALLAEVEAGLDFAEEDLTFITPEELIRRIDSVQAALGDLQGQVQDRGQADAPFRIVLVGPPNAGKSSLFNALLGRAAALISPYPGTTRDYLSGTIRVNSVKLELLDTPGRQTPHDAITSQAQSLRDQQQDQAELLLICFDSSIGLSDPDRSLLQQRPNQSILVATKCDLPPSVAAPAGAVQTSAWTGAGLAALRLALAERARLAVRPGAAAPTLSRCQEHLLHALTRLASARDLAHDGSRMELLAAELRAALDEIGAMVGTVYTEDLLDRIFSQFCIGK